MSSPTPATRMLCGILTQYRQMTRWCVPLPPLLYAVVFGFHTYPTIQSCITYEAENSNLIT